MTARSIRLASVVALLCLAGCGDEDRPTHGAGGWKHAEVRELSGGSGITVLGDTLFICSGEGSKTLRTVDVGALAHEGRVASREIPVQVRESQAVMGHDDLLASRGFTLGDLWRANVDLQGIGCQGPNLLFVADRAHRVVFWGRAEREIGGRFSTFRIEHGFVPPGAKRTNTEVLDFRDHGPGISGLCGVNDPKTEDLYVVERAHGGSGDPAHDFRVLLLDRFGSLGRSGFFVVRVPGDGPPAIEGTSWHGGRYLFVRGEGRGAIAPVRNPGLMRRSDLGSETPGPDVQGAGTWRGMAHGPDGTLYLVSAGDPGYVAWRSP